MAYTTINKSTDYFNIKTFTGNGSTNAITGVLHAPDLVWIKNRSRVEDHVLYDRVRGATKRINANTNNAESTKSNGLTAFGTDGFTVGSAGQSNYNGDNLVSWNWKANGTGSANTVGTINSTVSVNTTSGFSIVKYTGNGSSGATVGHGLGAVPRVIFVKQISSGGGTENWGVYHASNGNTKYMFLNSNAAVGTNSGYWNDTTPSSTVFTLGNNDVVNNNTVEYIAYCFAEKIGHTKFGKYTGNGQSGINGTFVYTGFKPRMIIMKHITSSESWHIFDDQRVANVYNPVYGRLQIDSTGAQNDGNNIWNFNSNGFQVYDTNSAYNTNGSEYIYMVFGQSLVGSNNVPCTAR